jgi:tetratricopeptide (TPR) repeat protein
MPMPHRSWIVASLLVAALFSVARAADGEGERRQAELDARIAELIEELGSSDFPVREQAVRELVQIGLPAFDALQAAQSHRDLEIGLRAKYLVGSANVSWAKDDDPPEVKSVLKGYGQQSEEERKTRIQRLGLLDGRQGWTALCRLARYERDERLSKLAALAIITQEQQPAKAEIAEIAKSLQLGAGESHRQASLWLRTYARWLSEPETIVPEWSRLVHAEFELQADKERTSAEVVTALGRWHAQSLHKLGYATEVKEMVKRLAGLVTQNAAPSLLDHVEWLNHSQMWSLVVEAYDQNRAAFDESPKLLYQLAQAQKQMGDSSAENTASAARGLVSSPGEHVDMAGDLAKHGMFAWAEAEYRVVIDGSDIETNENVMARRMLAEMLHDQEKDLAAGEVIEPISAAMEKLATDQFGKPQPNRMRRMLEGMGYDPGSMMSRMHYFYAMDHLRAGDKDKAVARLNRGLKEDADDVDVLIALYRLPDPTAEQKAEARRLIREATDSSRNTIVESSQSLSQVQAMANPEQLEYYKRRAAMAHNQFAWLVANTEGDYEAAVASSHESLKLRPGESAYLDTLGASYFATGDVANAIKYQSEAVRKDPHNGQMKRQLERFKKEAEKRK